MKAISLWQPWASLIAVGAKTIETRSWCPPTAVVGQRVAIHAAKRKDELWLCQQPPFFRYVTGALPLGALVATAVLERCTRMTPELVLDMEIDRPDEFAFGDYEPGRWAWQLRDVQALASPVPWPGRQGFFDVPDDLVGHEPAQQALDVGARP